jgi:PAS domain S-box-containing protein
MGIGIDISARRKMEQDLLRLATAVQQSGEGIIVASVDGVIEYVNPAFESISGYGLDELAGRKAHALDDYFNGYSLEEILTRTVLEGMTWTGRQQRKRKSGEIIDVDLSVSPVRDESGRITHFVSVVRDITRETRLQKQLALSQRMEAIGSLAGGIAHDLKNILTPILINTEIALEDMGEDSPSYPVLEEVLAAARLGRDLVQQILTFSRRAPQKKTPVNIPAVVRETLSVLRSTLPSTIEIRDELSDDRVMTYADATQIKQVLINLGSNAGYAMREAGGVLDVRETSMVLDEQTALQVSPDLKAGHYVQISVHDTGYGMDEGTMEHIFEPFFTTKKGEGTGMGLAVAHGIVKEHQGAITVKSTPGQGSTFTVMLPELEDGKEEDVRCRTSDTS